VVVQGIQKKVVRAVLSCDVRLREFDVLDRLEQWGEHRGMTEAKVQQLKQDLGSRFESFWTEVKKAGGPEEEEVTILSQPALNFHPDIEPPSSKRGKFLIVYTRNRKQAKLHKVGGCAWTSVTLADSQEVIKVSSTMYNSRCKLCWPEAVAGQGDGVSDCTSDSDF
jgi:hypothetical protein